MREKRCKKKSLFQKVSGIHKKLLERYLGNLQIQEEAILIVIANPMIKKWRSADTPRLKLNFI